MTDLAFAMPFPTQPSPLGRAARPYKNLNAGRRDRASRVYAERRRVILFRRNYRTDLIVKGQVPVGYRELTTVLRQAMAGQGTPVQKIGAEIQAQAPGGTGLKGAALRGAMRNAWGRPSRPENFSGGKKPTSAYELDL